MATSGKSSSSSSKKSTTPKKSTKPKPAAKAAAEGASSVAAKPDAPTKAPDNPNPGSDGKSTVEAQPQAGKADRLMSAVQSGKESAKDTSDPTLIQPEEEKAKDSKPAPKKAEATKNTSVSETKKIEPAKDTPEPVETASPASQSTKEASGSGLFGPVIGGLVAGAIGFGIALIAFPEGVSPNRDTARVVAEQSDRIDEIQNLVSGVSADTDEISSRLEDFESAQSTISEEVASVRANLGTLSEQVANAPQGDPTLISDELAAAIAAQKEELARLQGELEDMAAFAQTQIEAAEAEQADAEMAEARVKARGALNIVRDALAAGEPFAEALPDIEPAVEVPDALVQVADTGVASLTELQSSFATNARAALSASVRENAGSGTGDRLRLFLQDQLGARSLAPREGDDPDAVLSRAEAALRDGDLAESLETISTLPESGQAAMAEWTDEVETRKAAIEGFETLSDALSEN